MLRYKIKRWLIQLLHWAREAYPVIIFLAVVALGYIMAFVFWRSEFSIRLSGVVLQFIGMFLAIQGLRTLWPSIVSWLRRFPRWGGQNISSLGIATSSESALGLIVEVWRPDGTEHPTEERIARIVRNLETIRNEISQHNSSIRNLNRMLIEQETNINEHTENARKERKQLESLHTNGLFMSLLGLVWITLGIIVSTFAPEIYALY